MPTPFNSLTSQRAALQGIIGLHCMTRCALAGQDFGQEHLPAQRRAPSPRVRTPTWIAFSQNSQKRYLL